MRPIVVCLVLAAMLTPVSPSAAQVAATPAPPKTAAPSNAAAGPTVAPDKVADQTKTGGTVQTGDTVLSNGLSTIEGTVLTPGGQPLGLATVRARDLLTGEIAGETKTKPTGEYSLSLKPGSYVLEIVDDAGQIIGTSAFISAASGAAIAAATVMAASGTALSAAVGTATGLAATLGATAARGVGMAAAAAGVAGAVVPPALPVASPSR